MNLSISFFFRYYHFYTFQASSKKRGKENKNSFLTRLYITFILNIFFYFPNETSGTKSIQLLQSPKHMHLKKCNDCLFRIIVSFLAKYNNYKKNCAHIIVNINFICQELEIICILVHVILVFIPFD